MYVLELFYAFCINNFSCGLDCESHFVFYIYCLKLLKLIIIIESYWYRIKINEANGVEVGYINLILLGCLQFGSMSLNVSEFNQIYNPLKNFYGICKTMLDIIFILAFVVIIITSNVMNQALKDIARMKENNILVDLIFTPQKEIKNNLNKLNAEWSYSKDLL